MSNRHTIPHAGGAASVWPAELGHTMVIVGHTMVIGTTGAGKSTSAALYDMLRLTETEFGLVKGQPDTGAAGDEACA
ncbi:MAG: hypothetical protein IOC33_00445 [Burkholderia sp.]|uniref:hypothetical protein n=1 Tax=unclassified Burkholderia TaxID=2613784 RepID=UPI000B7A71CB|nr:MULTISPECIES: hypothetical protein [unclassified Burkholderia]MCA3785197.1 hypothetical protein [Burkholderia sp.]MCA3793080.1 hypothetical protein [Burkholderia sp.]MCA3804807.1 hypothetical protein [Burkholderia sp.]MCA3806733.1 hypothetical protein [Burkholderia sp.]MCA3829341.1 hypothetical protein [Burkholderia sp.]